jgi:hypothetical protein
MSITNAFSAARFRYGLCGKSCIAIILHSGEQIDFCICIAENTLEFAAPLLDLHNSVVKPTIVQILVPFSLIVRFINSSSSSELNSKR